MDRNFEKLYPYLLNRDEAKPYPTVIDGISLADILAKAPVTPEQMVTNKAVLAISLTCQIIPLYLLNQTVDARDIYRRVAAMYDVTPGLWADINGAVYATQTLFAAIQASLETEEKDDDVSNPDVEQK